MTTVKTPAACNLLNHPSNGAPDPTWRGTSLIDPVEIGTPLGKKRTFQMTVATSSRADQDISALASMIDAEIAQVARQAAHAVESAPPVMPARRPWRPFASYRVLIVTWVLCLGLTLLNLESGGIFSARSTAPDPLRLVQGLETLAAMDAVLIEGYRREHGVLPLSLTGVGLPDDDPTLEFIRTEQQSYRLIVRHGEFEGVYDSRLKAEKRTAAIQARAGEARHRAAEQQEQLANTETWLIEQERRAREFRRSRGDYEEEETFQ